MEISSLNDGDLTLFKIAGSLDAAAGPKVESTMRAAIDGGRHRVVLDLTGVGYISSSGVRAILVAAKAALNAGGGLAVFGLQPGVREVFDVSGLGNIIPIAASDAEARTSVCA